MALKHKIINDPIHGFIKMPKGIVMDLIDHPFYQRLRRIKQLGLTDYVYPGAIHTRFHHCIGAMHLMGVALDSLREKGHAISHHEYESALIAVLCHDLGHGPFSHALENSFIAGISHEDISSMLMRELNMEFGNRLSTAIEMFEDNYPRPFFHELISSQLDVDRLDYLKRDSHFTGVIEGELGTTRILKMLDLVDEHIVVEEKGIYSIEHFLSARRLMYWQVYLHKAVLSVEHMLIMIMRRARELKAKGMDVPCPEHIDFFLGQEITHTQFINHPDMLRHYVMLDDFDLWTCIKLWMNHADKALAQLCRCLLNRKTYRIMVSNEPFSAETEEKIALGLYEKLGIEYADLPYYVLKGSVTNSAYVSGGSGINILKKDGSIQDIASASDLENITAMSKIVRKYFLCWHKDLSLAEINL